MVERCTDHQLGAAFFRTSLLSVSSFTSIYDHVLRCSKMGAPPSENLYQAASSRNCDRRCRQLVTGPSGSPSIAGRCSAPSRIHACSRERRATWLPSFEPGLCALARTMSDVRCTPSRSLSIHRRSIRCAHGYNSGRATARPDIQTMHEQHLALGVLRSLAPASTSLLGSHLRPLVNFQSPQLLQCLLNDRTIAKIAF